MFLRSGDSGRDSECGRATNPRSELTAKVAPGGIAGSMTLIDVFESVGRGARVGQVVG